MQARGFRCPDKCIHLEEPLQPIQAEELISLGMGGGAMPLPRVGWRGLGLMTVVLAASSAAAQESLVGAVMRSQARQAAHELPADLPMSEDGQEDADSQRQPGWNWDSRIESAAWLQPPGAPPAISTPRPPTAAPRATQFGAIRLASVPNMFGDLGLVSVTINATDRPSGQQPLNLGADMPLAGASRIGKIAENDSPIPRDRFFFNYNHFHNVFQVFEQVNPPIGPLLIRQQPIDRYTIGVEKTFFDGMTSVELRMPIIGNFDTQLQNVGVTGGNAGNLTVVLKGLLYMDEALAVGAGMSIETPTGSDTQTRIGTTRLQFNNEATHLLPYIGFVWSPGDPRWGWGSGWFATGFAQIDVAASSNTVGVLGPGGMTSQTLGKLTEQNLGFLDVGVGYWLFRDPDAPRMTGLAAIAEIHYTSTLQDADQLLGFVDGAPIPIGNPANRFDVVNGTVGVQMLLFDTSSLRVGGVFPIGNEDRRLFDSEIQVQFNRRF
jgi:hypothetical protein